MIHERSVDYTLPRMLLTYLRVLLKDLLVVLGESWTDDSYLNTSKKIQNRYKGTLRHTSIIKVQLSNVLVIGRLFSSKPLQITYTSSKKVFNIILTFLDTCEVVDNLVYFDGLGN